MPGERPRPNALDVFQECLHIIGELPPADRQRVIDALSNFKTWSPKVLGSLEAERDHDRWEAGFRSIVTILVGPSATFDIGEIVERVRGLAEDACQTCNGDQYVGRHEGPSDDHPQGLNWEEPCPDCNGGDHGE